MQKPATGRASLFRNKGGGGRVQGVLTKSGVTQFESMRKAIAKVTERDPNHVSDADVIETMTLLCGEMMPTWMGRTIKKVTGLAA